jgi:hypothetical protein
MGAIGCAQHVEDVEKRRDFKVMRFSVAPMMDWTRKSV